MGGEVIPAACKLSFITHGPMLAIAASPVDWFRVNSVKPLEHEIQGTSGFLVQNEPSTGDFSANAHESVAPMRATKRDRHANRISHRFPVPASSTRSRA